MAQIKVFYEPETELLTVSKHLAKLKLWNNLKMDNDVVWFLLGVAGLIVYLIFSALTEMGTKWPWRK
ncbi:MAG: hypothetical protein ACLFV6_06190 [Spirulinaceae cyanobacterium]